MAALAGNEIKVYVLQQLDGDAAPTTISQYTELCGIDTLEFNEERVELSKDEFCSTEEARLRFQGLRDGNGSLSGFYDTAAAGQTALAAALNGASDAVCWLCVAWTGNIADGTDHVKCIVNSRSRSASVDGRVEVSYELMFNGAVAAGPTT